MYLPQTDVRQVRTTSEGDMFIDLATQHFPADEDAIGSFHIKHIYNAGDGTAYAIYEENRDLLAVQFYLRDNLLTLCDEAIVQYMSINEIRLMRDIGEVSVDGISYLIESMAFNLITGEAGCQRIVIINLQPNY